MSWEGRGGREQARARSTRSVGYGVGTAMQRSAPNSRGFLSGWRRGSETGDKQRYRSISDTDHSEEDGMGALEMAQLYSKRDIEGTVADLAGLSWVQPRVLRAFSLFVMP